MFLSLKCEIHTRGVEREANVELTVAKLICLFNWIKASLGQGCKTEKSTSHQQTAGNALKDKEIWKFYDSSLFFTLKYCFKKWAEVNYQV